MKPLPTVLSLLLIAPWVAPWELHFGQNAPWKLPGTDIVASLSTARGPLFTRGPGGGSLYFTGDVAESVQVPHGPVVDATDELELRFWIYPELFSDHRGILWKGDRTVSPERVQYKVNTRPDGRLEFSSKGPQGEWQQAISSRPLPLRAWTHATIRFQKGEIAIWFGKEKVFQGPFAVESPGQAPLKVLPSCPVPAVIGRMAGRVGGAPAYPMMGALAEFAFETRCRTGEPDPGEPEKGSPLDSLIMYEQKRSLKDRQGAPVLTGMAEGEGPWMVEVTDDLAPERQLRQAAAVDGSGRFRFSLDDFAGALDLGTAGPVTLRLIKLRAKDPIRLAGLAWTTAEPRVRVTVDPRETFQTLTGFGACTYAAPKVIADPVERKRQFGPMMAEIRDAGITHLDFDFGSLASLEPTNDNDDPASMNMDAYRAQWRSRPEVSNFVAFLRYARSEGFQFGVRASSYCPWQVRTGAGASTHLVEEIAETWVAFLLLLKEEGLTPTHAVPVWEPSFHADTVAAICATTLRLARGHGFTFPIVGPYVITTGGQSMDMTAMPDRYDTGALYTRAYLKACGDQTRVVGLEDYASGTPLIRPNLDRLWKEVLTPASPGKPLELWMLEYGAPHGLGPWNFFPTRWHGPLSTWEGAFRLARELHQLLAGGVSRFYFWKAWDSIGEAPFAMPSSWGLVKGLKADEERRPPYYTGRLFWRNMPEGSRVLSARTDSDIPVSAVKNNRKYAVTLTNPRSTAVTVDLEVLKTALAIRGYVQTATEAIPTVEREIESTGESTFTVELPPRSVTTFTCRDGAQMAPYDRVSQGEKGDRRVLLSGAEWVNATTTRNTVIPYGVGGLDLAWRRDETTKGDWLILDRTRFRYGLSVWGPGSMTFAVPPGAKSFETLFGPDASNGKGVTTRLILLGDGKKRFESPWVSTGDPGVRVSLPVTGWAEIQLLVESQGAAGCSDLVDASFLLP